MIRTPRALRRAWRHCSGSPGQHGRCRPRPRSADSVRPARLQSRREYPGLLASADTAPAAPRPARVAAPATGAGPPGLRASRALSQIWIACGDRPADDLLHRVECAVRALELAVVSRSTRHVPLTRKATDHGDSRYIGAARNYLAAQVADQHAPAGA